MIISIVPILSPRQVHSTIRNIVYLSDINYKLPEEYQACMVGINQVLKICWDS
jgi:hypothetical protein